MEFTTVFLFMATFASILILPGPNSAFAVGQSLKYGVVGSLVVPLGFMTATALHAALVFSGIGLVIQEYSIILSVLKWLGVLYLLYLACKSFVAKPSRVDITQQAIPMLKMYLSALFVSLTNPKALLASFMVYPLFLNTEESYVMQAVILSSAAMVISFVIYGSYSLAAVTLKNRFKSNKSENKLMGGLYISAASILASK
jgi:homoserine/homoserine lactone efflux protein